MLSRGRDSFTGNYYSYNIKGQFREKPELFFCFNENEEEKEKLLMRKTVNYEMA